ncbi:MAG: hypothetical protein EOP04_00475 [Proteobacteria bacterium]|nr:MAG: hypothetical protein EOP04_00475 [Pseudomonadota bacterium]
MENTNASVTLFLDTRKEKKDGTYPVKLTVYFEGAKRRYSTGFDLTKADWEKMNTSNLRDDNLKIAKRKLFAKKEKAEKIIDQMEVFAFDEFHNVFFHEKKARQSSDLKALFDEYIQTLENSGRVGSSGLYQTTINSLLAFRPNLKVNHITKEFLAEFEAYMLTRKVSQKSSKTISPTTIGIYMRHLRTIINIAISKKILSADKYPYKGYAIPSSRNVKKSLSAAHIKKLLNYQTDDVDLRKGIDFWIFSYISNGINFTDICNLRPENIQGGFFSFFRAKTKNTKKRDRRPIKVPLTPETKAIIDRWRNTDPSNPYLFPILKAGLSPMQEKYKIQDFIWKVNKAMNSIAAELGFEGKIGTYVARHSHSTILKRSGASTEMIKENLGHSSVVTTENYLDDFEDDLKIELARKLTEL